MITIRPYVHCDGIPTMRDSSIVGLYDLMERDGTAETVFFDGMIKNGQDFLNYIKSPGVVLLVANSKDTPVGCGWLNGFESNTARAHFCLFSEGWGGNSVNIGKKMVEKAISIFGLDMLIGMIPSINERAINFSLACGAKLAGEFPFGSVDASGKSYRTTILYYVR